MSDPMRQEMTLRERTQGYVGELHSWDSEAKFHPSFREFWSVFGSKGVGLRNIVAEVGMTVADVRAIVCLTGVSSITPNFLRKVAVLVRYFFEGFLKTEEQLQALFTMSVDVSMETCSEDACCSEYSRPVQIAKAYQTVEGFLGEGGYDFLLEELKRRGMELQ